MLLTDLPVRSPDSGHLLEAITVAANRARVAILVSLLTPQGLRHIHVNDHAVKLLDLTREDLADPEAVWKAIAPEDLPRLKERYAKRLRGELMTPHDELTLVHKDGSRLRVELTTAAVEYEGTPANVSFFSDIGERHRVQKALAGSEARFRSLVEAAPDGVAIMQHGRFVYANPAGLRLLGVERVEQLDGIPLADLHPPEDLERLQRRVGKMLETGQAPSEPAEYHLRAVDGAERVVEVRSIPIEHGGAPAIIGMVRDVTTRNASREQLIQADRLASLGHLSAGIAHEINNPLGYATLNLDMLRRELPQLSEHPERLDTLIERLEAAQHGVRQASQIVGELLSFARAGQREPAAVDLGEVMTRAIKIASVELHPQARLTWEEGEIPAVLGDAAQLEQVFVNLLINADQSISDRKGEHEIRLTASANGTSDVIVEISDTGCGIPAEQLGRIFDPFFTTKIDGKGTGLGLSVSHGIIEAMGGTLSVRSEVEKGTTFTLSLPQYNGA